MEVRDRNFGGRGPSHTASVCAVSIPTMLLADHSLGPFLESYGTPQTSLLGELVPGAWLVPRASSFLPRNCLTSPPFGPSGARTASPVCAVLGTSLGEAISLIPGERLALEASSTAELGLGAHPLIPSWLKEKADVRECTDASNPVSLSCVVELVGLPPGLCATCPRPDQMRPKVAPAHWPPGRCAHRGDGPAARCPPG